MRLPQRLARLHRDLLPEEQTLMAVPDRSWFNLEIGGGEIPQKNY